MSRAEQLALLQELRTKYEKEKAKGLSLDLSRGKPSPDQLDLMNDLFDSMDSSVDCYTEDGVDCRNYGLLTGIPEAKRLFSDLLNEDDGVFTSLLRAKGLSEMEVAVTIDRFIFELRHELEEYGYCRLGEIGTLRVEPTTKVLKLYPPVQGELPKQTPYVPKSLETRDGVSGTNEIDGTNGTTETNGQNIITPKPPKSPKSPNASNAPNTPTPNASNASKAPTKPRKKRVDLVMVAAIVILLAALAGIGYGWYVSNLGGEDDDAAAMDALRVAPEQTINE